MSAIAMRKLHWSLPNLIALAVLLVMGIGVAMLLRVLLVEQPASNRHLVSVALVRPPPEIKNPLEQPVAKPPEENGPSVEIPEDTSETPPVGDRLGVDAAGGAGGDAFGLIGKKGGRGLIGADAEGDQLRQYAGVIERDISAHLSEYANIRRRHYSVIVKLWIKRDGAIGNVELTDSTGSADLDHAIGRALSDLGRLHEAPPADMPQPVRLRLTSR